MKSSASSIQPHFAAARTRHCSAVIVRYQGTAATGALIVARGCSVVAEPACDLAVSVDTPVAEERPARAHGFDVGEVDLDDEHGLAVDRRARDDAAVGS